MGYVHRNVRTSNVVLEGGNGTCKLTGFGHVAKLDCGGEYIETQGIVV